MVSILTLSISVDDFTSGYNLNVEYHFLNSLKILDEVQCGRTVAECIGNDSKCLLRGPCSASLMHVGKHTKHLHDLANRQSRAIYQMVSTNTYTSYFCLKHNKLYMDEKEIFSSL